VASERIKKMADHQGVLRKAARILPPELYGDLLRCLSELQDSECHRTRSFPYTRLHRLSAVKEPVYRADISKISGWRIHVLYGDDSVLHLCDIIEGSAHDRPVQEVKRKKGRYKL
jgi:hypothetical protein